MRETTLYMIYNLVSGKIYVGISTNLKTRWAAHRKHAKHQTCKNCCAIHLAMKKYGIEKFIFKEIETLPTWSDACERKIDWIKFLKSSGYQLYNETEGGEGHLGKRGPQNLTPEQRQKISERMSGTKNYFYGKKLSGAANGHYGKKMLPHVKKILLESNSKLTKQQVDEMRLLYNTKQKTQTQLSADYNLALPTIHKIVNGQRWNDGTLPTKISKPQLKAEDVLKIREMYETGKYTYEELRKQFNISIAQVSRIITRKKWKNI